MLDKFKKCLGCPERWGRPEDIIKYKDELRQLSFNIDYVMTSIDCFK